MKFKRLVDTKNYSTKYFGGRVQKAVVMCHIVYLENSIKCSFEINKCWKMFDVVLKRISL